MAFRWKEPGSQTSIVRSLLVTKRRAKLYREEPVSFTCLATPPAPSYPDSILQFQTEYESIKQL